LAFYFLYYFLMMSLRTQKWIILTLLPSLNREASRLSRLEEHLLISTKSRQSTIGLKASLTL
jgi:hypothetical protein